MRFAEIGNELLKFKEFIFDSFISHSKFSYGMPCNSSFIGTPYVSDMSSIVTFIGEVICVGMFWDCFIFVFFFFFAIQCCLSNIAFNRSFFVFLSRMPRVIFYLRDFLYTGTKKKKGITFAHIMLN